MKITQAIKELIQGKKPLIDIYHFIVGNYRYKLYYSKDKIGAIRAYGSKHPLMRQHIWEQIKYRIKNMNPKCFSTGSCIKCGCNTTELQMADKRCNGICYPTMMNKEDWERFKINGLYNETDGIWMRIEVFEHNGTSYKKDEFYKI